LIADGVDEYWEDLRMEQLTFDLSTAKIGCPPPGNRCDLTFQSGAATALIQGTAGEMERFAQAILSKLDQLMDTGPDSPSRARYAGSKVPVALTVEAQSVGDGHILLHFVSAHHGHLRVVLPPGLINEIASWASNPPRRSDLN
jgi:hypothetical protein